MKRSSAALKTAAAGVAVVSKRRGPVKLEYEEGATSGSGSGSGSAAAAVSVPAPAPTPLSPPRKGMSSSTAAVAAPEADPTSPSRGYGKPIEPHAGWRKHLEGIQKMRSKGGVAFGAAVDTMGCEKCADDSSAPQVQRFQTLVSLMLSSQTKDEITYAACQRLLTGVEGGFNASGVAGTPLDKLEALIYPVGFYRNKAKFLQAAGKDCMEKYNGDIPPSVEELCMLKGVGPKMAFIAMSSAWGKTVGIGVDTHVHRICNRLQWVKTDNPKATQAHLQTWLPQEEWGPLNVLLVGMGQTICTPLSPKCGECAIQKLCPYGGGKKASLEACV